MSDPAKEYSVLLSKPGPWDPPAVANVLAKVNKVPFQDAIRIAKNSWGIISQDMDEESAAYLAGKLIASGVGSLVLHRSRIADLPEVRQIRKAILDENDLKILAERGEPGRETGWDSVSWRNVVLIAAAGFNERMIQKVKVKEGPSTAQKAANIGILMATGLPIKVGKQEREVEKEEEVNELVFYLDIILGEPSGRLRIDAQNFDFSCLRERMQYSILGNFRLLVSELVLKAPESVRNRGAQVLLDGRPIREMGYEALTDLERESRWLMTLTAQGSR